MEERLSAAGGELTAELRHGLATVTLQRPAALNALSLGMIQGLAKWLQDWTVDERVRVILLRGAGEKAFCAGGDVRALRESFQSGSPLYRDFFSLEYALDHRIHTYPKPIVALLDGIVMGGGMGLAQGATLRIVGDRTRMAMPETTIGLFPDVGGSYFLSRLPGKLGIYLGLAGPTLRACDAVYCGLADAYLAPEQIDRLPEELERAARSDDPATAVRELAPPHEDGMLPPCELQKLRPAIDRHFGGASLEAIMASLATETSGPDAEWAARTLEALRKRSPTMLKVTLEQLRRGATLGLADCFRMELDLVHGCFAQGDFVEGIRALLVDKDNAPRWNPPAIEQVDRAAVERFFTPRWSPAEHPLASL